MQRNSTRFVDKADRQLKTVENKEIEKSHGPKMKVNRCPEETERSNRLRAGFFFWFGV